MYYFLDLCFRSMLKRTDKSVLFLFSYAIIHIIFVDKIRNEKEKIYGKKNGIYPIQRKKLRYCENWH